MPREVGSGGQRWPFFTVYQLCAHTDIRCKAQEPDALGSQVRTAQELCKLVQRDLLKGVR